MWGCDNVCKPVRLPPPKCNNYRDYSDPCKLAVDCYRQNIIGCYERANSAPPKGKRDKSITPQENLPEPKKVRSRSVDPASRKNHEKNGKNKNTMKNKSNNKSATQTQKNNKPPFPPHATGKGNEPKKDHPKTEQSKSDDPKRTQLKTIEPGKDNYTNSKNKSDKLDNDVSKNSKSKKAQPKNDKLESGESKNDELNVPATIKSLEKSAEEHEYLHFLLGITEDILKNNLYTNSGINKVINSHIEANKGRLSESKMNEHVERLKKELNYPLANTKIPKNPDKEIYICLCSGEMQTGGDDTTPTKLCDCSPGLNEICDCKENQFKQNDTDSNYQNKNNPNVPKGVENEKGLQTEKQNKKNRPNKEKKNELENNDNKNFLDGNSNPDEDNILKDTPSKTEKSQQLTGDKDKSNASSSVQLNPDAPDSSKCFNPSFCFNTDQTTETPIKSAMKKLSRNSQTSDVKISENTAPSYTDNSIFKMINKSINNEEKTAQLVLYRDDGESCRCTFAFRKTALKIQMDDESADNDEYVLVDGPVCMPKKMLETKTMQVLIENASDSEINISGSNQQTAPYSNVNFLKDSLSNVSHESANNNNNNNNATLPQNTPLKGEELAKTENYDLTPERENDQPKTESDESKKDTDYWRGYYALFCDASTSMTDIDFPDNESPNSFKSNTSGSATDSGITDKSEKIINTTEPIVEKHNPSSAIESKAPNIRKISQDKGLAYPLRIFEYSTQKKIEPPTQMKTFPLMAIQKESNTPSDITFGSSRAEEDPAPIRRSILVNAPSLVSSISKSNPRGSYEQKVKVVPPKSEPIALVNMDEVPTNEKSANSGTVHDITEKLKEYRKLSDEDPEKVIHVDPDKYQLKEVNDKDDDDDAKSIDNKKKQKCCGIIRKYKR